MLEGYENLVVLRNALKSATNAETQTPGPVGARARGPEREPSEQLAQYNQTTLSRREHINQLKADLKSLEDGNRRLEGGTRSTGSPGTTWRASRARATGST